MIFWLASAPLDFNLLKNGFNLFLLSAICSLAQKHCMLFELFECCCRYIYYVHAKTAELTHLRIELRVIARKCGPNAKHLFENLFIIRCIIDICFSECNVHMYRNSIGLCWPPCIRRNSMKCSVDGQQSSSHSLSFRFFLSINHSRFNFSLSKFTFSILVHIANMLCEYGNGIVEVIKVPFCQNPNTEWK